MARSLTAWQATARLPQAARVSLDVPGHAFGPRRHPQINTMMAVRRALSTRPTPISDLGVPVAGRITLSDRRRSVPGARVSDLCGQLLQVGCPVCDADLGHLHT